MYRFHPSVQWSSGYPDRQQIVSQITQLLKRYGLQERTKFNTKVTSTSLDKQGRWIINDPSSGRYDGIIAAGWLLWGRKLKVALEFKVSYELKILSGQDTHYSKSGGFQRRNLSLITTGRQDGSR